MLLSVAIGFSGLCSWHLRYRPKALLASPLGFCLLFVRVVLFICLLDFLANAAGILLFPVLVVTFLLSAVLLAQASRQNSFIPDVLNTLVWGIPLHLTLAIVLILLLPILLLQFVLLGVEGIRVEPPSESEGTGHRPKPQATRPVDDPTLIGRLGTVATALRPSGKIKLDGRLYEAISGTADFIDAGEQVIVSDLKMAALEVKRVTPSEVRPE